uniref:Uncharacterized protein n=1 Tax=Romanomermis culicivorax TaxID=13658 RepID=A0A915LA94_ROMCU
MDVKKRKRERQEESKGNARKTTILQKIADVNGIISSYTHSRPEIDEKYQFLVKNDFKNKSVKKRKYFGASRRNDAVAACVLRVDFFVMFIRKKLSEDKKFKLIELVREKEFLLNVQSLDYKDVRKKLILECNR